VAVVDTSLDDPVAGVEERDIFPGRPAPPMKPFHSRFVCSVILSIAPLCRVVLYPAILWGRVGTPELAAALGAAGAADVINLSLAYGVDDSAVRALLEKAGRSGSLIAASHNPRMPWPAAYGMVVSAAGSGGDVNIDDRAFGMRGASYSAAKLSGLFALAKSADRGVPSSMVLEALSSLNPGFQAPPCRQPPSNSRHFRARG